MKPFKSYFPIFQQYPELVFLDNASTSQKPQVLLNALNKYYSNYNSNIGRSVYSLSHKSEQLYLKSIDTIKAFFGVSDGKLIFTDGCTSSLNQTTLFIEQLLESTSKQTIILSPYEHHANLLPWMELAKKHSLSIYWLTDHKELENPDLIQKSVLEDTIIVSLTHVSNVTGETNDIKSWSTTCQKNNILLSVDGAQAVSSIKEPLQSIKPDFYSFSAHKIYGPMGLGVLYLSESVLKKLTPTKLGGGIIEDVTLDDYSLLPTYEKFDAGTQNIANIFAFAETLNWIKPYFSDILFTQHKLIDYAFSELNNNHNINILNFLSKKNPASIISFTVNNIHPHDLGTFLDQHNIAVRVGKHCANPLHLGLGFNSSIRISTAGYNLESDITKFLTALNKGIEFLK